MFVMKKIIIREEKSAFFSFSFFYTMREYDALAVRPGNERKWSITYPPQVQQQGIKAKVMDSSHTPLLQSGNHKDVATCEAKPCYWR